MMFHGTYRSEFYRAIRDLLHDEVKHREIATELRARWHALLLREPEYRLDAQSTAVAG
jgi:hypothetical protein